MAINKKTNEYALELKAYYDSVPKAVLAAIAVSYASSGGDYIDNAARNVANEWRVLHEQGIVPQKPPLFVFAISESEAA